MRLARQKNPRSRWRAEKLQKQMLSNLSANFMEEEQEASKPELPDALLHFLKENGLDPSIYPESHSTPRYVRIKPGLEARIEEIEAEIKWKLEEVEWLPGFYALPPDVQVANSNAYREGKIYGIDAASGAAVSALDISAGDHVLDLCAAPGIPQWTCSNPHIPAGKSAAL